MKEFKKLNNIIGWAVFMIATFVYLATMEKTASLWDCGEFISAAYKLEVVHAPGAPLFLMMGRIFTLFAGDDVTQVAVMVNSMSALASSFTILFLFWTITAFGRKIYLKEGEIETSKIYAILGAGIVGSLAYTFSDSFWFSAVEGEVYALSSFFTAITFWCIMKWEEVADTPHSSKWLVLIAYLIGLSIGVHLLSLLTIPAMGMIYYFKNNKYSHLGVLKAFVVSSVILVVIQGIFIPKTASLMGWFDRIFVNSFNMPFNSGVIFFFLLVIGGIILGLFLTRKAGGSTWNTVILGVLVLLIGYSSYATVILRSSANTPINIGSPDDPLKLSSYLQRDQYGDWPIVSGQNYNQKYPFVEPKRDRRGRAVTIETGRDYYKNEGSFDNLEGVWIEKPHYEDLGAKIQYTYDKSSFFPRMWSDQKVSGYKRWRRANGKDPNVKITFGENLKFFFDYQIGWSYMRYFMWNFAGRQNDIMNMDQNDVYGNWESGINTTKYNDAPSHLKENKGKNHYYFLPLIIGLIGIFFHFKSAKTDALSVLLFFLFTGVLIIVYLNVPPDQPRERDYAYVGSFYAFAIWIGIGVLGIFDLLKNKINGKNSAILATVACFAAAPLLMASENWDDHNRSGRTIAIDVAKNYLEGLAPNALIFTNGDNDTYPLWYAQEVEEVRLDVKVVNMSLLGMDWYIDQVKHQVYDAAPVPSLLTYDDYKGNNKNGTNINKNKKPKNSIKAIKQIKAGKGCPRNIVIKVDKSKIPTEDIELWGQENILTEIPLIVKGRRINQHEIALLDILSNFGFSRPIYFISAQQTLDRFSMIGKGNPQTQKKLEKYIGLLDFVQEEGAVSRLVPFRTNYAQQKNVDTEKSLDAIMNNYKYGNIMDSLGNRTKVNFDYYSVRSIVGFRYPFLRTANALMQNGETEKAIEVADKYFESLPYSTDLLDPVSINMSKIYVDTKHEEGYRWVKELLSEFELQFNYLVKLERKGGYLSADGKRLKKYSEQSIKELQNLNKQIEKKEELTNTISEEKKEMMSTTNSGLSYIIINKGSGDIYPNVTSKVTVHYTGKLEDGTIFDSSVQRGEPATFALNQVIPGWTEVLQLMSIGDKWEVTIPSNLAYGETGMPQAGIGPNTTLIFEIELLEIL